MIILLCVTKILKTIERILLILTLAPLGRPPRQPLSRPDSLSQPLASPSPSLDAARQGAGASSHRASEANVLDQPIEAIIALLVHVSVNVSMCPGLRVSV